MTQVTHSEKEFYEVETRAETLHRQYIESRKQPENHFGGDLTTKDRFDYWIYVATKERIVYLMNREDGEE